MRKQDLIPVNRHHEKTTAIDGILSSVYYITYLQKNLFYLSAIMACVFRYRVKNDYYEKWKNNWF